MTRSLWFGVGILLCPVISQAQFLSAGIKAGVPITQAYTSATYQTNARYTVGPTVEVRLGWHFSLEADALYRTSTWGLLGTHISASVHEWQAPFLVKRELFAADRFRPFVSGGEVYRRVTGLSGNTNFPISYPAHPNMAGFSAGGGVTTKFGILRLSPEIRYTRWSQSAFDNPLSTANPSGWSTLNQADFLLGLTF